MHMRRAPRATDRAELVSYSFRKVRARILAENDVCIVCGHGAADAVDHIQPVAKGGARCASASATARRALGRWPR